MKQEHLLERQAALMELAGKAYDLWGRILDAQIDYLNENSPVLKSQRGELLKPIFEWDDGVIGYAEGQPQQIDLDEKGVDFEGRYGEIHREYSEYNGQAGMAEYLFKLTLERAEKLPDGHGFTPAPPQKPAKQKPAKTFTATTKNEEEIAEYTGVITEKMTADLDKIHADYSVEKSEKTKKKQFASGETKLHISTGGETIEQKIRNRFVILQEDASQVVLWLGQAGGPRYAPFLQLPGDRVRFALSMVNLGKAPGEHISQETLWDHIEKAAEQGLLTDVENPKITPEGLEHIQERLAQDREIVQDRPLAYA